MTETVRCDCPLCTVKAVGQTTGRTYDLTIEGVRDMTTFSNIYCRTTWPEYEPAPRPRPRPDIRWLGRTGLLDPANLRRLEP